MSGLFENFPYFPDVIIHWDTSNVTNMGSMFKRSCFNQDIGHWDVSNVQNMHSMFKNANCFNQDLSGWNVQSVMFMEEMFNGVHMTFNRNIGNWNVRNVKTMRKMFSGCIPDYDFSCMIVSYNADISNFFDNYEDPNKESGDDGNAGYTWILPTRILMMRKIRTKINMQHTLSFYQYIDFYTKL